MKKVLLWAAPPVILLLAVLLPRLVDINAYRPQIASAMSKALGREVGIGGLRLTLLSGGVSAKDLTIAEDPKYGKGPFVQASSVSIGVELLPLLLHRRLNVTAVKIDNPQITLVESAQGEWNFATLGSQTAATPSPASDQPGNKLDLAVKLVRISNGRFSVGRTGRSKPLVLESVSAELRDFSAMTASPFSFAARIAGGGEIKLEGQAGPLPADLSRTPAQASLKITKFDLAGSGWTQAEPGIGGIVSLDGGLKSDGKRASVNGKLRAEKVRLSPHGTAAARPVELDLALVHDLDTRAGRIEQSTLRIGSAQAGFSGSYATHGEQTELRLGMAGPDMPLTELATMLPALGLSLPKGATIQGGTARLKFESAGAIDRLMTSGTIALNNATIAGFDLGRKMAVVEALAGISTGTATEIQELSTSFNIGPDGTALNDLRFNAPAVGEVAGAGTITPDSALDFHMTAKLHGQGRLSAVAQTAVPFTVKGTCADPVFRPNVGSMAKQEVKDAGVKAAKGLLNRFLGGKK